MKFTLGKHAKYLAIFEAYPNVQNRGFLAFERKGLCALWWLSYVTNRWEVLLQAVKG